MRNKVGEEDGGRGEIYPKEEIAMYLEDISMFNKNYYKIRVRGVVEEE